MRSVRAAMASSEITPPSRTLTAIASSSPRAPSTDVKASLTDPLVVTASADTLVRSEPSVVSAPSGFTVMSAAATAT